MPTSMTPDRISELLAPFVAPAVLATEQLAAMQTYLELLSKWNSKLNLTSIRDPEEIMTRHFGESIFAATQLFPSADSTKSVIDVGSGPGFPGLPIKLWCPAIHLTLVESNQRKATFLREVIRALQLNGAEVLSARAETLSIRADLVTLRAVEKFAQVLPIAAKLVDSDGRLAVLIGEMQVETAKARLPDLRWQALIAIPQSRTRVLLIGAA